MTVKELVRRLQGLVDAGKIDGDELVINAAYHRVRLRRWEDAFAAEGEVALGVTPVAAIHVEIEVPGGTREV